jgi:hypothetical protein
MIECYSRAKALKESQDFSQRWKRYATQKPAYGAAEAAPFQNSSAFAADGGAAGGAEQAGFLVGDDLHRDGFDQVPQAAFVEE